MTSGPRACLKCNAINRNRNNECIPCASAAKRLRDAARPTVGLSAERVRALMADEKELIAEMRRPLAERKSKW